ncbi:hypothetical protein [Prevotella pallens]|uniref:hypothetical protein n=1 Tax=Prevotella pallens TaxID=60133 RepID=UPI001CAFCADF|nr:hypothetical protein [Prevotella pallens]MBF1483053.1 hypothetical protein [Prevotella pallens]
MKRYKLLKDLPTFKAGQLAYISEQGSLIAGNPDKPEITDAGVQLMMYHKTTLEKFPEILTEWFEEIQEPTDSIHWEPKIGDRYFYISGYGTVYSETWHGVPVDYYRRALGFICPTEEECKKARERKLAKVRLQRTSNFKPNFEDANGGWTVYYSYKDKKMNSFFAGYDDAGEIVCYETKEEAEKSIEENREDWLIYFGVKE